MNPLILVPAYGRKYETAQDAVRDYLAGKDFKIFGGPYTSIRDREVLIEEYNFIFIAWNTTSFTEVTDMKRRS